MEIIIAKNGGFCKGVETAVNTAMSVPPENTYVFGEIIHNPEVVRNIMDRGIVTVDSIDDVPNGATLIIRSHGVGKNVYELCTAKNIRILDCTCPFVKRTQDIIKNQHALGKTIVIVGEKSHPERSEERV